LSKAALGGYHYHFLIVIPMAVKRARAFTSARVGRRDLVLAF
jgi:hypothetical protein